MNDNQYGNIINGYPFLQHYIYLYTKSAVIKMLIIYAAITKYPDKFGYKLMLYLSNPLFNSSYDEYQNITQIIFVSDYVTTKLDV